MAAPELTKLWILLDRLANGGLERVQVNIATELKQRNIDVSIVAGKVTPHYGSSKAINFPIIELSPRSKLLFPYYLIKKIYVDRPSHIMTTSNDVACMLIVINFFLSEKIDITVSHHLSISEPIRRAKRFKRIKLKMVVNLMRILYPYAQNIVAVSNGVADDLSYTSRTDRKRIATIYNPIVSKTFASKISEGVIEQSSFKNSLPTVIFVGRICPVKRIDIILAAIEKVILKTPVDLLIVGDGPDINDLEKQIREKCLQEFCVLTGFVENPLPLIAASDVLVLTSDYEGFGNVLVEAMACGTQVISTKCPYGPEEILGDNQFGQLIPTDDSDALVSAILNVVEGRFLVEKSVLESRAMDFSVELAVSKYLDIFEKRI